MAQGLKFDNQAFISLNAATTGTGESVAMHNCKQVSWFTAFSGTVSGGTIIVEWAKDQNYAQTWQLLDSIDASLLAGGLAGSGTYPAPIDGFMRARISVNITGGGDITLTLNGLLA